jgi:hypothetical protein
VDVDSDNTQLQKEVEQGAGWVGMSNPESGPSFKILGPVYPVLTSKSKFDDPVHL